MLSFEFNDTIKYWIFISKHEKKKRSNNFGFRTIIRFTVNNVSNFLGSKILKLNYKTH